MEMLCPLVPDAVEVDCVQLSAVAVRLSVQSPAVADFSSFQLPEMIVSAVGITAPPCGKNRHSISHGP